jgi:hypothetical protein
MANLLYFKAVLAAGRPQGLVSGAQQTPGQ